ncbi:hypothetical protein MMC16_002110 [Acarospora aff. strigata]|nr:hypothetical protein [Acarospora aff. strigata]
MLLSKASLLTILLHIHAFKSVGTGAGSSSIQSPEHFENGDEVLQCMTEYGAPNLEDCRAALKKLADEAQVHDPMDFEWVSHLNMPRHLNLIQLDLPWAYVHGQSLSCFFQLFLLFLHSYLPASRLLPGNIFSMTGMIAGTCTIRIARPPHGLINDPLVSDAMSHSMIRTFGDLKSVANRLLSLCVLGNRHGGFAMEGM